MSKVTKKINLAESPQFMPGMVKEPGKASRIIVKRKNQFSARPQVLQGRYGNFDKKPTKRSQNFRTLQSNRIIFLVRGFNDEFDKIQRGESDKFYFTAAL